jgi:hypothetical protein
MIENISGRVAYSVMSFGGFLGMGEEEHAVPWSKLTYDTNLGGYRTYITETTRRSDLAHATATGTGATAPGSGNCTTTTERRTIGAEPRASA